MTARCLHGRPVAVDGTGCDRCGPHAQLADVRAGREPVDARTARDRGLAAALERPAAEWDRRVVDQLIRHWAHTGREFTVDDLRPDLPAVALPVIGAAFMAAAMAGRIERVGDVQAKHANSHARRVGLWRGTRVSQPSPAPDVGQQPDDGRSSRSVREPVTAKAARLVAAGRVKVRLVDEDGRVVADVDGDSGTYTVRRTAAGHWSCPCTATSYGRGCSHITSVALVVA